MYTNVEELKGQQNALESEIRRFKDAIEYKFTKGEYDVDNMCGRVNQLERLLSIILNKLKSYDPCSPEFESEQDRKAIAIVGGGKGVEIRAKNDDPTKYTVKKRKTYGDILQVKMKPQPNGKHKQQQPQTTPV
jgi:hypothetical protein